MLTAAQIKWAASHDWFLADNGDGTIKVRDAYTTRDGAYHFSDIDWNGGFSALRDWAGY